MPAMTSPKKPMDDDAPWEPTVDSSSSDADDETNAASDYTDVYGGTAKQGSDDGSSDKPQDTTPTPTVTMAYTAAPDFKPAPPPKGGQAGRDVPPSPKFSVDLGGLRSLETTGLNSTSAIVDAYTKLRGKVTNASTSDSIFGQNVTTGEKRYGDDWGSKAHEGKGGDTPSDNTDKLDDEGTQFAASIVPAMEQLLVKAGGTVESLGVYCALLNNAGQVYAQSDRNSIFPDAG
jgi:hypothetical protein